MTATRGLLSTIICNNCGHQWRAFGTLANIRYQVEYIGGAVYGDHHYCAGCARHLGFVRIMEEAQ
jgi:ribosomal protein S26